MYIKFKMLSKMFTIINMLYTSLIPFNYTITSIFRSQLYMTSGYLCRWLLQTAGSRWCWLCQLFYIYGRPIYESTRRRSANGCKYWVKTGTLLIRNLAVSWLSVCLYPPNCLQLAGFFWIFFTFAVKKITENNIRIQKWSKSPLSLLITWYC